MGGLDEAAVERASSGFELALPCVRRGRLGEVRASSVGSSLELHDFRTYQPGDDLRQVDWNAVARTGQLVMRVRQDEVAPRVEVVLDGSRSLAVSEEKASRARELAALLCKAAARQGLEPTLLVTSKSPERVGGAWPALLRAAELDAQDDLAEALRRSPPLRPCGLRLVVSDFLFQAPMDRLLERLSHGAARLGLVQVLDREDLDPSGGHGARLVDAESGAFLERILTESVLSAYRARFARHQALLRSAAARVGAVLVRCSAEETLERLARGPLAALTPAGGAR